MKLADLGEFGFIDRLRRRTDAGEGVLLGIGDDCAAVVTPPGETLLMTSDLLIEGVHFRRDWTDWHRLGRKCVAVNVSDIAAMGGTPRFLLLGLGLPPQLPLAELDGLIDGFLEGARTYGALLVGGDTCRSPQGLFISVTAQGSVPREELVGRGGARPGQAIYVSGTLGDSALALRELLAGRTPDSFLASRHHDPSARVELGRRLAAARLPTAMIDLSDGLLADLGHVLASSGAGARIELERLPLSPSFRRALVEDPAAIDLALNGGEDYELLFAVPSDREEALAALTRGAEPPLTRIGVVTSATGEINVVDGKGRLYQSQQRGYNHFAPNT